MPRQSEFTEEIGKDICRLLIEGQTLTEICLDESKPVVGTVYVWLADNPPFEEAYTRARQHQADAWADLIREIADDSRNDYMERQALDGSIDLTLRPENINRSKLRIDTIKFLMSKYAPKRFGDKIDVNMSGKVEVETLSDTDLETRLLTRLGALGIEHAAPLLIGHVSSKPTEDEPELNSESDEH